MPCDSVQSSTVDLSEALKNPETIEAAITAMGGRIIQTQPLVAQLQGTRIVIAGGTLTMRDADEAETQRVAQQFTIAYGMAAAKQAADEQGWSFEQTSPTTFVTSRPSLSF
jgi:hypothetical protein